VLGIGTMIAMLPNKKFTPRRRIAQTPAQPESEVETVS
jgi:hypothetical protein